MAQVTANIVKPAPMNMPNMSVYNPYASPAASALNSRMGTSPTPTLSYNQRASAGLSPLLTPSQPRVSPINPGVSQHPAAQPYASAPVDNSALSSQLDAIKQQALKIQSAIPGASAGTALQAPVQPQTSATGATTASQPPTYSGLVGSLASASTNGSPAAQGYTANTANYGAGNIPIGQSAADIAKSYGEKIANVGSAGAAFKAGQLTTGTSPVAEGNAAVTAQTTAEQQQALAAGESAALQGTAQQLTAQDQAANAANAAAGQATTARGQALTGLNSAAGLAQPSATAQGQTTFNPLTGTFSGGSYQTNLQTVVNAIKSGNMGYTDGVNSLSSLSPTAKADVLAQLGSGFDTVASDANATAKGSNIQSAGTAATGANATGLSQSIQAETSLNTAAQSAQSLASQVGDAITKSGLNLTNSADANTAINNLQSRLGNAAYTQLNIAVNDARTAYSQILTDMGSTPTDAGNMANQNINSNMSPKQILGAIDQLNKGVFARQDAAHKQTQAYQSALSGGGSSAPSGTSGSSTGVVQTKVGSINTNW